MKNRFKILVPVMILGMFIGLNAATYAQPGPPPPPEGHGSTGNQAPGGGMAPIGSGLALLIGFGAAYGSKKLYRAWKKIDE